MKILVLTKYPALGPSSRYRFLQYIPAMIKAGFEPQVLPLFTEAYLHHLFAGRKSSAPYLLKRALARLVQCLGGKTYDLVWVEGELLPFLSGPLERCLHPFLPRRRVYDFDDAQWLRYEKHGLLRQKFASILKNAAGIVVGNRFLEAYTKTINPRTIVIPTVVDWQKYSGARPALNGKTIGWIGSSSTSFFLKSIFPVLRELKKKHDFTLKIVGAELKEAGIPTRSEIWSLETEVPLIETFDIGIMPLTATPWSEGKCGLKLIQYLAAGVPAVASAVGVNKQIIDRSGGGFLARELDDWLPLLEALLTREALRKELGRRGRNWVHREMTLQSQIPRLLGFLERCGS